MGSLWHVITLPARRRFSKASSSCGEPAAILQHGIIATHSRCHPLPQLGWSIYFNYWS